MKRTPDRRSKNNKGETRLVWISLVAVIHAGSTRQWIILEFFKSKLL